MSATVAFAAALFVDERRLAARRTQVTDLQRQLLRHRRVGVRMSIVPTVLTWRFRSLAEIFDQRLSNAVGQRPDALRAEAHWAPAADAGQLLGDVLQALERIHRRRQPQHERDQPAQRLGDRRSIRSGLSSPPVPREPVTYTVRPLQPSSQASM